MSATTVRAGLAVMECQTLTFGHVRLLSYMQATVGRGTVALGGARVSGVLGHPFSISQREAMVRTVYGDTFDFVHLDDIDTGPDAAVWCDYVLGKVAKAGLPVPTDYFSGSVEDAAWYVHRFAGTTATERLGSNALAAVYARSDGEATKRVHVVDRDATGYLSARHVRYFVETRDDAWKVSVPERLHEFVEANYPPSLRTPLSGADAPDAGRHPVGTLYAAPTGEVLELKDDGVWRPRRSGPDAKTAYAMSRRGQAAEGRLGTVEGG